MDEKRPSFLAEKRPPNSIGAQYVHDIYHDSGFVMVGYSEMNWTDKNGNPKPWPFANHKGWNFNNYFLRITCGKSPYYPGHERGMYQIIFYENTKEGNMVAKVTRGAIQWSNKYLVDKDWDKIRERLEWIVTEFLGKLPPNPNPLDLYNVKMRYSYSKQVDRITFDSKDLSRKWQSMKSLDNECKRIIEAGFPEGEVLHYRNQYIEKYFSSPRV